MKVAFVSCTKLKSHDVCTAKEMYQKSILFRKIVCYIEQHQYDAWFVLSAKYGLLKPATLIEPYDISLHQMNVSERKRWSQLVLSQFLSMNSDVSQIDFYAGKNYREYLIQPLQNIGIQCTVPLQGMGIGNQLGYLTKHLP